MGPVAATGTPTGTAGGQSSCTSSRFTYRPDVVTRSPASSARSVVAYSRMSVRGDAARAPTCPIQDCTPCPIPGISRPGNMPSTVATSIAVSATFRSGVGITPIPTRTRSVAARIALAAEMPPVWKQSSQSQISSIPAASIARASGMTRDGGVEGRMMHASVVMGTRCHGSSGQIQPLRAACQPSWMRVETPAMSISTLTRRCTVRSESPSWLATDWSVRPTSISPRMRAS